MGFVVLEASLPGQLARGVFGMVVDIVVRSCVIHGEQRSAG
jgi:hypothetical protein